ncbi:hypothetical protein H009_14718 [Agrobacterium tumefaciens str. Cherry 2E-2-2]|nr:hypothetical protein H009_14718 [Agrobacterium tumefaciens str. Cherry 2E-2-2]
MNEKDTTIELTGLLVSPGSFSLTLDLEDGRGPLPISLIIDEADAEIGAANALIKAYEMNRSAGETMDRASDLKADGHSSSTSPAPASILDELGNKKREDDEEIDAAKDIEACTIGRDTGE